MLPVKLKIKICGMRDFENVKNVLKHQPDYMGFIFYEKSQRIVTEEQMDKLLNLNFGATKRVGVFVNESPDRIIELFEKGYFDLIQLHGDESPEDIIKLKYEGIEIIKVFSVGEYFDPAILKKYEQIADYFLFDTKGLNPGGNGVKFNWNVLQGVKISKPFFLSGGLEVSDLKLAQLMGIDNMIALDYNSKIELLPGLKDLDEVEKLLKD
ncbi:phosphoribosylanthranilate isomerase [Marivirga sp. S37H4]|uniref:N-(5'-phosphoribosyl)anthranilate isomerase n=2 Tax=Marivirga aurantiaca TaxID=2802615 RepID=A0A934WYU9_9BACT|nr:phosphoribosylanthranilate isomerase [Marivirga aurantiaca]